MSEPVKTTSIAAALVYSAQKANEEMIESEIKKPQVNHVQDREKVEPVVKKKGKADAAVDRVEISREAKRRLEAPPVADKG